MSRLRWVDEAEASTLYLYGLNVAVVNEFQRTWEGQVFVKKGIIRVFESSRTRAKREVARLVAKIMKRHKSRRRTKKP